MPRPQPSGAIEAVLDQPAAPRGVRRHRYANGFVALWSSTEDPDELAAAVADAATGEPMALAIVWFSRSRLQGAPLADALNRCAPSLPIAGSSTCGEITPDGLQSDGSVVLMIPARHADATTTPIEHVDTAGVGAIAAKAAAARERFLDEHAERTAAATVALTLIDGLTFAEEATTAALQRGLGDVPLIGGSAGDDLRFERSELLHGKRVYHRSALLVLLHLRLPFRLFTDNNFVPTDTKLVVTRADPDRRIVYEFNAEPAASAYARAIGRDPRKLDAVGFAAHPLVLRIGGELFCRSVQQVDADGSLTFFCAIDNGLVLTLARSEGMVRASRQAIDALEDEIGDIDCLIGFDCIYRKLDALHRGAGDRMQALFREKHVVGCNTYGEQFGSMHVNQTFTGIAFGQPDPRGPAATETPQPVA